MARKGLPASIVKKYGISKKAWEIFRKGKSVSSARTKRTKLKSKREYTDSMPRKKSKSKRRKSTTIPIAVLLGASAGLINPIARAASGQASWDWAVRDAVANYTGVVTGYDSSGNFVSYFSFDKLKQGLLPLFVGTGVHILASKLGVNRALGRAKVPFLRI